MKTAALVIGFTLALFSVSVQDASAQGTGELCCCTRFFETESCAITPWRVGQMPEEVCVPGYVWQGGPVSECPVAEQTTPETELYFQPNVPIPGQFEGRQPVDGNLLGRYLRAFYVYFVWVVGILAAVMVMYAGIQWITAAGNSSRIENAKTTMNGALIGLVLALASYVILRTINPTLVRFENLSIFKVPTILVDENVEQSEKGAPAVPLPTEPTDVSKIGNVTKWDSQIQSIAGEFELDPYYVKAIMMIESRGNPDAISKDGACGLLQVMKYNSGDVCLRGEANAEANLRAGMLFMRSLFQETCPLKARYKKSGKYTTCQPSATNCTKDWHYVIAAYNGGRGSNCSSKDCAGQTWWECEKNEGFDETRKYVPAVEAMVQQVRRWGWVD